MENKAASFLSQSTCGLTPVDRHLEVILLYNVCDWPFTPWTYSTKSSKGKIMYHS